MIVLIPMPKQQQLRQLEFRHDIILWLNEHAAGRLTYREDYDSWAAEFTGADAELNATAFKLVFGV